MGRTQLLLSALALCSVGVLYQIQDLKRLSPERMAQRQQQVRQQQVRQQQQDQQRHHMAGKQLYIPSLEFSMSNTGNFTRTKQSLLDILDCTKPVKELEWEWFNVMEELKEPNKEKKNDKSNKNKNIITNNNSNKKKKVKSKNKKPRLLIAISSGFDKYAEMLTISAHLAKVYALTHNATVVVLQGTSFAPDGCTPPVHHATLNKIRLLFLAIDQSDRYDQVLLLEADTLIVNMDVDLRSLLSISSSSQDLVAAQPVRQGDGSTSPRRHQINAGITLWNLHHDQCKDVALRWFDGAQQAVMKGTYQGDQRFLQLSLKQQKGIRLLDQEFAYDQGTLVKHYFLHSAKWQDRKKLMEKEAKKVCETYDCTGVASKEYSGQWGEGLVETSDWVSEWSLRWYPPHAVSCSIKVNTLLQPSRGSKVSCISFLDHTLLVK